MGNGGIDDIRGSGGVESVESDGDVERDRDVDLSVSFGKGDSRSKKGAPGKISLA